MKYLILILFILFSSEFLAQDTTEVKIYSSVLQVGEILNFGRGSVKFKEVISDSRCPKGVTCIWPGEAKVLVELYEKGIFKKEKIITIGGGKIPLKLLAEGISYNVNHSVLLPYPDLETGKEPVPYSLHIKVSEIADSL